MSPVPLYDAFSGDYDRFVNWDGRLSHELPFVEQRLRGVDARWVLDAACGTGAHAIALAQRGYSVMGADLSGGMIGRARVNAAAAGLDVRFVVAGFGQLQERVGAGFDALLCLGNSLPHALEPGALHAALADFAAVLRPGGLLLVQNRNFDAVLSARARWMPPESYREGRHEWLFLRFYDFEPGGTLGFNLITLRREGDGPWSQHVEATQLRPLPQHDLSEAVAQAGFDRIDLYGDMAGAPFDPQTSPNLVLTARHIPPSRNLPTR